MKKIYENPILDVINFDNEDIITGSPNSPEGLLSFIDIPDGEEEI